MVVDKEITRILTLLRNKIRERGFTQLEVQDSLGWGRSYISQLLTRQKSLRVEQVLLILEVIGVEPSDFYGELYRFAAVEGQGDAFGAADVSFPSRPATSFSPHTGPNPAERQRCQDVKSIVHGLVQVLLDKDVMTANELSLAVRESEGEDVQ
jgi:transcriptional regulator with XRE-family HTH domain